MSAQTETVVRRFLEECLTAKNIALMDDLFSPEYVNNAATPDISPDLNGYRERIGYMIAAFPDLNIEIHDLFSYDDRVAVRLTARGTHKGAYLGVAPSGGQASCAREENPTWFCDIAGGKPYAAGTCGDRR